MPSSGKQSAAAISSQQLAISNQRKLHRNERKERKEKAL
jgi:hypothetical protein